MGTRYNYDNGIPCQNPNCKSYGKPHPNCQCGGGGFGHAIGRLGERVLSGFGGTSQSEGYAHGGEVGHCSSCLPHAPECEHYADGGEVAENHRFASDPELAVDHAVVHNGLHHTLTKTGHSKAKDHSAEFVSHSRRGKKALESHAKNLFNPKAAPVTSNEENVAALEKHLDDLRANPASAHDVGGSLGFPDHHLHLAGKLASVMNHFDSIKPRAMQGGPLDPAMPASKKELAEYRRQLAIAENPALVYQRAKDAQLQPGDMATLKNVYPKLHQSMVNQAGDAVVDHKAAGNDLPKSAKNGMSILMQQNLGFLQTPAAMQAIIKANTAQAPQAKPGHATNKAVDESNKQAALEATPIQARQLERKA